MLDLASQLCYPCPGFESFLPSREAEKEVELLEKKMQRLEAARAAEIAQLTAELEGARTSMVEQLSAKDSKVNDLVEELGNTQALLSEKEAALNEVCTTRQNPIPLATCHQPGRLHPKRWTVTDSGSKYLQCRTTI